jgi:hypothetical protein
MSTFPFTLPQFVVLSFERPEGERFAIFRPNDWLRAASPAQWRSPITHIAAMEQFVRTLELLTEEALRTRLAEMGIATDAVTQHIVKARNTRQMESKGGGSWEIVTTLGYRNEEGQVVVAKTVRTDGDDPAQHVFVLRCSVCGHEYGTYGVEIPHRRCPNCQDGPPGLRR